MSDRMRQVIVTAAGGAAHGGVEHFVLERNGWMPNNARLPVLLYRGALDAAAREPALVEARLARHRWPAQWRNGIYAFHHYHSTAHEILGFVAGAATVTLGGPDGRTAELCAGDVLALPVGTGHCLRRRSDDLLVIGAYPAGQLWDVCRAAPDAAAIARMADLAFPPTDPLTGPEGALPQLWV